MKNVMLTICLVVLLTGMVLVQGCDEDKPISKAKNAFAEQKSNSNQIPKCIARPVESKPQIKKQWTVADLHESNLLKEEISALQQIIANKEGKWNAEMIRECQTELRQKEAALRALYKKYQ